MPELYSDPLLSSTNAYYRFENGATEDDSSGNGNSLTSLGAPTNGTGKFGGCVDLAGEATDQNLGGVTDNNEFEANYWRSQPFTPTKDNISAVGLQLKKTGSPTGNLTIEIQTDNSGVPSGTVLSTATLDVSTLTTSYAEKKIIVTANLTASTKYHVCLKGLSTWDASNDIVWGAVTGTGYAQFNYGPGNFNFNATTKQFSVKTYYFSGYSLADSSDLKPTGIFTIGAWIKLSDTATDKIIFSSFEQEEAVTVAGIYFRVNGPGPGANCVRLTSGKNTGVNLSTDYNRIESTKTVTDNSWHFAVGVYDGSYLRMYIDGVEDATPVAWSYGPGYSVNNAIGVGYRKTTIDNGYTKFFIGSLDDLWLMKGTALTAEQIANLYNDTVASTNYLTNYRPRRRTPGLVSV